MVTEQNELHSEVDTFGDTIDYGKTLKIAIFRKNEDKFDVRTAKLLARVIKLNLPEMLRKTELLSKQLLEKDRIAAAQAAEKFINDI